MVLRVIFAGRTELASVLNTEAPETGLAGNDDVLKLRGYADASCVADNPQGFVLGDGRTDPRGTLVFQKGHKKAGAESICRWFGRLLRTRGRNGKKRNRENCGGDSRSDHALW
jgi:hypothetical protein